MKLLYPAVHQAEGQVAPTADRVWGLSGRAWLLLALLLGCAVRFYYFAIKGGMHYPDEIFQYLEPANWRMQGFAWLPWEFDRGVRNWFLPAYYGALLEWGRLLGLERLGLHTFVILHNTLFSLLLIPAGFRLGRAVGRGSPHLALFGGLAMALFPLFGYFAPHTLSELHGLLLTTWAYALWMELVAEPGQPREARRALVVGVLLGLAVIVRYTAVVFIPLVGLDLLLRKRFRATLALSAGLLAMAVLLGLVDWITWGGFLHSFIEYIQYNLIEQGNAHHGVMPWHFYWTHSLVARFGPALWLCLAASLAVCWRHWRMLAAWILPFVALSAIQHKEERFLLSIWPFFLVAALNGLLLLGRAAATMHVRASQTVRDRLAVGLTGAGLAAICVFNFIGTAELPMRWKADVYRGQAFVGAQADAAGVLIDDRIHLNGGYTLLGRNIPQVQFDPRLAQHALFNYCILYDQRHIAWLKRLGTFEPAASFDSVTVFRRR